MKNKADVIGTNYPFGMSNIIDLNDYADEKKYWGCLIKGKNVIKNSYPVCFGGKRLRGAFTYESYRMFNGRDEKEILKVSAVMELLHSYLLIHDDVMDSSDIRHSRPTIHKVYEKESDKYIPNYSNAPHFGESIAINIGDILCHLALMNLAKTDFKAEVKIEAMGKIHREFTDTGYGQIIDCFGTILPDVKEDHVLKVHYFKTGKYTYETPLHVGAILAGAAQNELRYLTEYAIPGGMAFQIQDDILGMFGNEEKIGKPADSDLKEGKKTLLIIKALEKATNDQRYILNNALGNEELKQEDLEKVRQIIVDTGSLDYSKDIAKKYMIQAKEALDQFNPRKVRKESLDFLTGIADYVINRDV